MAGPVCSILMPRGASVRDLAETLIALVSDMREDDHFWVNRTTTIGGQYEGVGQPYVQVQTPFALNQDGPERSLADKAALVQVLGWEPQCEVDLIAMCSGSDNHRILGELALWWLLACPQAVVDMGDDMEALRALPFGRCRHLMRWAKVNLGTEPSPTPTACALGWPATGFTWSSDRTC